MKNKLDRILLAILWLIAITLGACFWFNTIYAFNIFSARHWQYVATLQASQTPITGTFYISIITFVAAMIVGLYVLVRPRFRKIRLPRVVENKEHQAALKQKQEQKQKDEAAQTIEPAMPAQPTHTETDTKTTRTETNTPDAIQPLRRPARLNIGAGISGNTYPAAAPQAPVATPQFAPTATAAPTAQINAQIRDIFTAAGYTYKGAPKIKGMQTSVLAIAVDEVLWIGAVGASLSAMHNAVDALRRVFSDTLDDIEISVNAFIIAAADTADVSTDNDILLFADVNELRTYMAAHPAPATSDADAGGFDAYSAYISTVIDYIGKI